jgi:hypothetical protein
VRLLVILLLAGCAKHASPTPAAPSFRSDVAPVLERMCARAEGCHGNKPTDSVDLDLRASGSYAQLVGVAAQARKGALRVAPGAPASSFLVDKLTGRLGPREGKRMPIDAQTGAPIDPSPIDPGYVERILTAWIAAGAPNN